MLNFICQCNAINAFIDSSKLHPIGQETLVFASHPVNQKLTRARNGTFTFRTTEFSCYLGLRCLRLGQMTVSVTFWTRDRLKHFLANHQSHCSFAILLTKALLRSFTLFISADDATTTRGTWVCKNLTPRAIYLAWTAKLCKVHFCFAKCIIA